MHDKVRIIIHVISISNQRPALSQPPPNRERGLAVGAAERAPVDADALERWRVVRLLVPMSPQPLRRVGSDPPAARRSSLTDLTNDKLAIPRTS